jgi:hypothetical protein
MEVSDAIHAPAALATGKKHHWIWPEVFGGEKKKTLFLPEFELRTIKPVASRHRPTDCATPVPTYGFVLLTNYYQNVLHQCKLVMRLHISAIVIDF